MSETSGNVKTGNVRIDDTLEKLEQLDDLPVAAHPDIFDDIHTGLRDALANAGRDEDPALSS